MVGLRQQLIVDGGKGVALPPKVEGGALPPHVDRLRHPSLEPSLFSVDDGDAVVVDGMPSFLEVLADRRGGAVVFIKPILQLSRRLSNVCVITFLALNFIDHSGLVQLVQFVLWVDKSGPDGVCGPDVDLDAPLSDVACKGVRYWS